VEEVLLLPKKKFQSRTKKFCITLLFEGALTRRCSCPRFS